MTRRHRASVVCVAHQHLLVVHLRDPLSGTTFHVVPGGAIEPGESAAVAAARETHEETGLAVQVDEASEIVATYRFLWNGTDYETTTHFFRASPVAPGPVLSPLVPAVEPEPYQLGALWLPLSSAERLLSFHDAIWQATQALL